MKKVMFTMVFAVALTVGWIFLVAHLAKNVYEETSKVGLKHVLSDLWEGKAK